MPIAHISLHNANNGATSKFYEAALAPVGYKLAFTFGGGRTVAFADQQTGSSFALHDPAVWMHQAEVAVGPKHIAFFARSQEEVKASYDAAIAAGGKDNGAPGPRPNYGPAYYGAFVYDPEGRNIEFVYISPEAAVEA